MEVQSAQKTGLGNIKDLDSVQRDRKKPGQNGQQRDDVNEKKLREL